MADGEFLRTTGLFRWGRGASFAKQGNLPCIVRPRLEMARFGHPAMSARQSLSGAKRTLRRGAEIDANDPCETSTRI